MPREYLLYMEEEGFDLKPWVSIICGVVGVSLLGSSIFVYAEIEAHRLMYDITRWIMIIAGSLAIIVAVVSFFSLEAPDE